MPTHPGEPGTLSDPAFVGDAPVRGQPGDSFVQDSPRGNWPPMVRLSEEAKLRLKDFLSTEIRRARHERQDLVSDWTNWQADYWAQPAQDQKDFPFTKAANIVVPLTAIAVEAVHARLMNTVFGAEPLWSIRPQNEQWVEHAKPAENFLESERKNSSALDVYDFAQDSLMELVKLGTAIGKSGYTRDIRKSGRHTPTDPGEGNGMQVDDFWHERHNGATLDYVPVANFLMRLHENDPQEATWVGEEHRFTWSQMKRMAQSGRLLASGVENVKQHWIREHEESKSGGSAGQDYEEDLDEQLHLDPHWATMFDVQEIWLSFDVDGDGYDEEIVVDYSYEADEILSIRFNWYDDLHRPYRITQYVRVEGRWAGIGIAKQNEQFQEEVTTVHRQRLDNATLANMRMIAIKKNSGYGPDEPVFPGKMWFLDNPQEDIQPLEMSEIYQSAIINEQELVRYSEKRTGVNEVLLGMQPQGTPGTATGDLARIQEGNKRFDLVLKNVRNWLGQLGQDVLSNYQQFGAQRRHFLVEDPRDAQLVEQIFQMPSSLVADGAIVELSATDSQTNKQVEQQQWMSLFQTLQQYYSVVFENSQILAQVTGNPQLVAQTAQRALRAADEAMRRLLQTFDVADAERLLFLNEQEGRQGGPAAPQGGPPRVPQSGPNGRTGRAVRGAGQEAGLGGVAELLEGLRGRGNGRNDLGQLGARGTPRTG